MPPEKTLAEEEHDSFTAWVSVAHHVAPAMTPAQRSKLITVFRRDGLLLNPVLAARARGLVRALSFT
jgi:hypothetical protein